MRLKRIYHQDKLVRTHQVTGTNKLRVGDDGSVLVVHHPETYDKLVEAGLSEEELVTLGKAKFIPPGGVVEVSPGAVSGVKILQAKSGLQKFTQQMIDGGLAEGWLTFNNGVITINSVDGVSVSYRILRNPGIYCCHCDVRLGDCGEGSSIKNSSKFLAHVRNEHGATDSPDACNPSGYRQENHYTCINDGKGIDSLSPEEAKELELSIRKEFQSRIHDRMAYAQARAKAIAKSRGN